MDACTRTAERATLAVKASLRTESHVELDAARFDHATIINAGIPEQRDSLGGHGHLMCECSLDIPSNELIGQFGKVVSDPQVRFQARLRPG